MYCDYCGYSWIYTQCKLCGRSVRSCGCDVPDICEEHFCVECGEPFLWLSEDGTCYDCIKENDGFIYIDG